MTYRTPPPPAGQLRLTCQRLADTHGLPFAQHLPEQPIRQALALQGVSFREHLFTPWVTLWAFLSQVLDPDPSCRQAVARLLAWRTAQGLPPCSPKNDAYCKARGKLPEGALAQLTRDTGRELLGRAEGPWLWKGRAVKVVDGTCLSMPDTPANQAAYPQPRSQKPGCGFPLLRLVVVFALAVGTVLDAAMGRYRGKGTGETSLWRSLPDVLADGDILLADRCYCSYWEVAAALARGADVVLRLNPAWAKGLGHCRRLPSGDRLLRLAKPRRPDWLSEAEYAEVAEAVWVRVVHVRVRQRGFRTQQLLVATTLTQAEASRQEIAGLYRARWQAELDLRTLKVTLKMDVLRCQSPAMVRKEVWAHLLGYNLIRSLMAQAAVQAQVHPEELSFTGALQTLNAFLPQLRAAPTEAAAARLWGVVRWAIGRHRVGDRPDRYEPRKVKRRPKNYTRLTEPRAQARARLAQRT